MPPKGRKPKKKVNKAPAKKPRKQIPYYSSSPSDTEHVRETGVDETSEAEAIDTRAIVSPPRSPSPPPDVIGTRTAVSGPVVSGPTPYPSNSTQHVTQNKKGKPKKSGMLSEEEEESMLEFLQANTFLYNMKSKEYKDKALRAQVWQTQANKMELDVETIMLWYTSIRTRYVKLTNKKSGDGARPETQLTDRDNWILANFGFIKKYIRKTKQKVTVSMRQKIAAREAGDIPRAVVGGNADGSNSSLEDDMADVMMVIDGQEQTVIRSRSTSPVVHRSSVASSSVPSSAGPSGKKAAAQNKKEEDKAFMAQMSQRAVAAAKFQSQILRLTAEPEPQSQTQPTSERDRFITRFSSVADNLHQTLWPRFRRESIGMLLRFQEENDTFQLQQAARPLETPTPVPGNHQQAPPTPGLTETRQNQQQPQPTYPSYSHGGWNEAFNEGYFGHYMKQSQNQSHSSRPHYHQTGYSAELTQLQPRPRSMPDPTSLPAATSGYMDFTYGSGNQPSWNTIAPLSATVVSQRQPSGPSRQTSDGSLCDHMAISEPLDANIEVTSPSDLGQTNATVDRHVSPDNNDDSR